MRIFCSSRISWIRISDWLPISFHFGTENLNEQLKIPPCTNLKDTAGQSASPSVLHPSLYFGISQGSLVSFNVTLQFLFRCCKQLCQNWAEFNEEPLQQAMLCKVTVFLLLRGVLIVHCTVGEGAKKAN